TDLLSVILDHTPGSPSPEPDDWRPAPEPGGATLVAHALARRATSPYEAMRSALAAARGPRRVTRKAVDIARGAAEFRRLAGPGTSSSLNGPIGAHRRWDWARARLSDIRSVREAQGGTVNDVVLVAITA